MELLVVAFDKFEGIFICKFNYESSMPYQDAFMHKYRGSYFFKDVVYCEVYNLKKETFCFACAINGEDFRFIYNGPSTIECEYNVECGMFSFIAQS